MHAPTGKTPSGSYILLTSLEKLIQIKLAPFHVARKRRLCKIAREVGFREELPQIPWAKSSGECHKEEELRKNVSLKLFPIWYPKLI